MVAARTLGDGSKIIDGHIAGTPVIVGEIAYLVSPLTSAIVAVQIRSGDIAWLTRMDVARGSPSVIGDRVFVAKADGTYAILDKLTGILSCTGALSGTSDRAGLTVAGAVGILTLTNGQVLARSLSSWLRCSAS